MQKYQSKTFFKVNRKDKITPFFFYLILNVNC